MREITVNKNDSGQRLDKFLRKAVPKLPGSLINKYIRLKRIKLNGKRCHNNDFLEENDILSLYINDEFFERERNAVEDELDRIISVPDIVYEDSNIIIAYKRSGVDVHRGSERTRDTFVDMIRAYLYRKGEYIPSEENSFSPAVCNRLDRNTSGLVIAAKNAAALREMNECIRKKRIQKKYLCICGGRFSCEHGTETAYHKKGQHNLVSIRKDKREGYKEIVTEYRVLEKKDGLALTEVDLITGRTHQIRAHLAFLGAPVLGDGKYGNISLNKRHGIFRQQLCAYSLEFETADSPIFKYLDGKRFKAPETGFGYNGFDLNDLSKMK